MKRLIPVSVMVALFCGFAWSIPTEARLVQVRASHQRVVKHRAHKAGKHHAPKHTHHAV